MKALGVMWMAGTWLMTGDPSKSNRILRVEQQRANIYREHADMVYEAGMTPRVHQQRQGNNSISKPGRAGLSRHVLVGVVGVERQHCGCCLAYDGGCAVQHHLLGGNRTNV